MTPIWILGLLCCLSGTAHAAEVCFEDLGCFDDQPPWGGTEQRPLSLLPWSTETIGTRFLLFTQRNHYYQEIKPNDTILSASNYSGAKKTRFIIPGYLEDKDQDWPQHMCKAMIKWQNINCVAVEWKKGTKTEYAQAANNGRVVAAQVAFFIQFIMGRYKQRADKFHIIGHCLGAHIAGEVGGKISGLARITGLDPTEPYFQGCDARIRLDRGDASFVDVIHTDGLPFNTNLGLGMSEAIGHVDFYPNGGDLMPGCSKNKGSGSDLDAIWEGTKKNFDPCNHVRAHQYYSESINKPYGFLGYPCSDSDSFANEKCFPCADNTCPLMGHDSDKFTSMYVNATKFFLHTGSSKPFGRYSYRAEVTLDGPWWPNLGTIYVALTARKQTTEEYKVHVGTLVPGTVYNVFINAETNVGEVTEMKFRWNNHIINPMFPKYGAAHIQLEQGKGGKIYNFCGTGNVRENTVQTVPPCQEGPAKSGPAVSLNTPQ
ncbi:inactive pancreatic lipase-related protein 1-like [Lampris incognitus]|uniref:inactive pancreatic lipase-related protein 1-like n=1 Tax=Lampris incognitus TaxID=2546036 RepID=UPI0024B4BE9D|nr:inactive pancreatic lipase-related protein 1-like [Lampris incognitus]